MTYLQDSARSFLGIAKETTKGTPVAPTDFFPITLSKLKPEPHIDQLFDNGLRGSSTTRYGVQQGRKHSTYSLGGAVFADMIGYFLAGILGEDVVTGASAPYLHTMSLKNSATVADTQPKAFTLTDFTAVVTQQYAGMQVEEITFTFTKDGLLEFDAKLMGWFPADTTVPTPTFSGVIPIPVWQATVTIAGVAVSILTEGSITLKRTANAVFGISDTQDPYAIFLGPLEVTGKLNMLMDSTAEYARFTAGDKPSLVIDWTNGAGATLTQLGITMSESAYTAATVERGKDYVEVAITIDPLANITDAGAVGYSPIKVALQNAKPTGTYQ